MKKYVFIFFLSLSNLMFSQTTELQSKGTYVWQASDEAKTFKEKLQMSFVSANQGFPSFGTVLAGSGYSATQDGGVFQLYFPYSSQYGGVAPRVRMGKYNNQGWTDWNTFYTSANANNASTNWATKKLIADDLIQSKGTLSLYSSSAGLGDVISLYGNRLGLTSNYGFGVESGALYNKSVASHRWYIAKNADKGVSAKMELSNDRLFVNGNVGIGTKTPTKKLEVYDNAPILSLRNKSDGVSSYGWLEFNDVNSRMGYVGFGSSSTNHLYLYNQIGGNILLSTTGGVGIGTGNTQGYKLAVAGGKGIIAEEVTVKLQANWPDYVFENRYNLPTLKEVENHIQEKGHLQNIPSAKEVAKNGIQLGEMNKKLLEKIEELTLYTIQQEKRIEKLETKNTELENQDKKIEALEKKLNALLSKK